MAEASSALRAICLVSLIGALASLALILVGAPGKWSTDLLFMTCLWGWSMYQDKANQGVFDQPPKPLTNTGIAICLVCLVFQVACAPGIVLEGAEMAYVLFWLYFLYSVPTWSQLQEPVAEPMAESKV